MFVNKGDLVAKIATETRENKSTVAKIIDSFLESLSSALEQGEFVTISRFGRFATYERRSRKLRDPRSGSVVTVAPSLTAKFSPSPELKRSLKKK